MCGRRQQQRTNPCGAPVQSSPLRAIWSRTIHCMATSNRIAHNCGVTKAREVIPQPTPQPNTSKETRRCWRRVVGPCPAQTFCLTFQQLPTTFTVTFLNFWLDQEQAPFRCATSTPSHVYGTRVTKRGRSVRYRLISLSRTRCILPFTFTRAPSPCARLRGLFQQLNS